MSTIEKYLPVKLTDEELRLKGEKLAELELAYALREEKKKEEAKEAKEDLEGLRRDMAVVAHEIRSREETRLVECDEIPDYAMRIARIRRLDTLKVVGTRPLQQDELQRPLPMMEH